MYANIEQMKAYRKFVRAFSRKFGANEATVQKVADNLIALAKANADTLTPAVVVAAESNTGMDLYRLFVGVPEEQKTAVAEAVLAQIPFLVSSTNEIYVLNQ